MSDTPKENTNQKKPKNKESFASGLFSLMTKQCIFSGLLFGILYGLKNTKLSFAEPVCSFVKNVVCSDITLSAFKNIISGFFI